VSGPPKLPAEWIVRLATLPDQRARRTLLQRHPRFSHPALIERICEEVPKRARIDLRQAESLAQAALLLADTQDDDYWRARARRAMGHVFALRGNYQDALGCYESALEVFRRLKRDSDAGITLSGALQTLIYLGHYTRAAAWAGQARKIFTRQRDSLRLGRLDSNLGNLFFRQDRFDKALVLYRRAYASFRRRGAPQDVAITLRNLAVCQMSLGDFSAALRTYEKGRAYSLRHGLPLLVGEADYNVAYLHYLRGHYARAIELYRKARAHCETLGDPYHQALCDLDQSELYLELNLAEEGAQMADQARARFEALGMRYETGKALTNLASALSQQGREADALALFAQARDCFRRERNPVSLALLDLQEAFVLFRMRRYSRARRCCDRAAAVFHASGLPGRSSVCELLLARLDLASGQPLAAERRCRSALKRVNQADSPALTLQMHFVLGQAQERLGRYPEALAAYKRAHACLETLRTHVRGDELKVAFLKDKLALYESLVWMSLEAGEADAGAAFSYIEQAKSRSLTDLIASSAVELPGKSRGNPELVAAVGKLREALNSCDRQIAVEEVRAGGPTNERLMSLRKRAAASERALIKGMNDVRESDWEFTALQRGGTADLRTIQAAIRPDTLLLEYYEARGMLYLCLLGRDQFEVVPLGPASRVQDHLQRLQLQLSKFRFGPSYVRACSEALSIASRASLQKLYAALVAPVRDRLKARHLIVVPHNFLHHLPFHALFDGERYLLDAFSFSYIPSASLHHLQRTRHATRGQGALVLGIPDKAAPQIRDEVRAVAAELPNARVFVGRTATERQLRELGPTSRVVHIATHGRFRQDNPMFSSIRLGTSDLRSLDLYGLRLSPELVTLSGCGTGLSTVVAGDELVGLVRGWLYAGAQAVLATLWDVNDQSTAEFMSLFYRNLQTTADKAVALQQAMGQLRERFPHPYYWAPFVLIGVYENVSGHAPVDGSAHVKRS
jgi:CHAT domain-containing protein